MRMLKCIIFFVLFVCITASNAQTWVVVDSAEAQQRTPVINVLTSNRDKYEIKVNIPGFYKKIISESGNNYDCVYINEFQTLSLLGEPALPVINKVIGLPKNSSCNYTITGEKWVTLTSGKIYPFQKPKTEDETDFIFNIIDSIYNMDEYSSEICNIGNEMCLSGMINRNLSICPFHYYPNANRLMVLKEFVLTVNFTQNTTTDNSSYNIYNSDLLKKYIDNFNDSILQTYNQTNSQSLSTDQNSSYDYLIITAPAYINNSSLNEFCLWKKTKGYNCKIITTTEIGGNTPAIIKNYIRNEYNNGIKYVLFVGNNSDIPLYYWAYSSSANKQSTKGDYWYSCVDPNSDSDYQADLAVGRFCVNNETDLINMINKTIKYENASSSNDNWTLKNLLVAHQQYAPYQYQQCSEEIRTASYNESPVFTTAYGASTSNGGNNATNSTVINAINNNLGIVNYRGHGSETGWASYWSYSDNAEFNSSKVAELTNDKKPIVFSIACQNGNITYSNCLLYSFTHSTAGAVAFLGATENSYTDVNHIFDKKIYYQLYNNNIYNIGNISNLAKLMTINYYSNSGYPIANAMAYLWGGDPSLEIWTNTISSFPNINVSEQNNNIIANIGNLSNCILTVFSEENNNYFSRVSNVTGNVVFDNVSMPCYLSVNKHNFTPYVCYISNNDIYIQNKTYSTTNNMLGNNIYIGYNVTNIKENGNVIISSGTNVKWKASNKIVIKNGFKCEKGSRLSIM
jgi:hypothetical protein